MISPIGEIDKKTVQYFDTYIIFEGMIYNLTKRLNDLKKDYQNPKKYKIFSCQYRRENENNK